MRTQQDWLLRFYSDGMYAIETTGSVDELGYFALTSIGDETEQRTMLWVFGWPADDIEDGQFLEPGWYIVESTDQGFEYGTCYESELDARDAYAVIEAEYAEYDANSEE